MRIVDVTGESPARSALDIAIRALEAGLLVGIPTDTVYGLAADVSNTGSADRLFAIKQRSRSVELPVLVCDIDQAMSVAVGVPPPAERLMEKFWPGALTLVLPRDPDFVADLGSDDETVGVRCPGHIVPRLLAEEVGPIATTSANMHGRPPLTTAQSVLDTFPEGIEVVLDGGTCDKPASTVIDFTGSEPKLLRAGAIPWDEILEVID